MITIIGFIAAILTTASFLPQAIKTIKTKDTSGISLMMYILFSAGILLWLVYGIFINDLAVISANAVTFVFALIILFYKLKSPRS
ncbi:SemiSWEET transporter [Gottfriedia solisilvae]|uniref:Membrane protein n=1 Tax=Gottfriedia solisilvae TaxID=1516104 RepID=A0A8J3ACC5_9BACI|nr:SemiSWEET transporter [Gottfriedia solisilvae]GGI11016.1 membrane protein [Gottfriedia solisilvae]